MAKTDKGVFGVRGKLAHLVYYERYGQTYIRLAPQFPKKRTFTPKQLVAKQKFAKANLLMRVLRFLAPISYIEQKGKGSMHHKMVGQINKYAIKGETLEELAIMPELLPISFGSLPPEMNLTISNHEAKVEITWTADVGNKTDELVLVSLVMMDYPEFLNPNLKFEELVYDVKVNHTQTARSSKVIQIDKQDLAYERVKRIWLYGYFTNKDRTKCSPSTYLGSFELVS
ncbi:hypothetical protein EP331_00790 [bacterium]|nr:MAG: hypothetical protein EP331_00790 [bacterium]